MSINSLNISKTVKKIKNKPALLCLLSFISGAFYITAMPPFNLWWIALICLGLLYAVIQINSCSTLRAFLYGYFFGLGQFIFGLYWIGNALLVEGNEDYKWLWPFAVIALPIFLAIFIGLSTALYKKFFYGNDTGSLLSFIALISLSEFARGHLFTGLPWNLVGYIWSNSEYVMQTVSIGGIYLLGILTLLWACLPVHLLFFCKNNKSKIFLLTVLLITVAGTITYGYYRFNYLNTENNKNMEIQVVQPNIGQSDKWNPHKIQENLTTLLNLSYPQRNTVSEDYNNDQVADTKLIIWPETAITSYLINNENVKSAISTMMNAHKEKNVYLVTGILHKSDQNITNSIIIYDRNLNEIAKYDKSHLVPFGEYVPLSNYIPLDSITGFSGFEPGIGRKNIGINDINISPVICYEVIFPGKITPNQSEDKTDLIINATNDAWYGDSTGPRQHFAMTRFRAIEEGAPLIRVANTGISGYIDAKGNVKQIINLQESGSFTLSHISGRAESVTLFSRLGTIPYAFSVLLCLLPLILKKFRIYLLHT